VEIGADGGVVCAEDVGVNVPSPCATAPLVVASIGADDDVEVGVAVGVVVSEEVGVEIGSKHGSKHDNAGVSSNEHTNDIAEFEPDVGVNSHARDGSGCGGAEVGAAVSALYE